MKRILHIVNSMNRGGIETFIMNVYRNIDRTKMQFDFILHTENESSYEKEIKHLGGRIFRIPSRRQGLSNNRKHLETFFEEHKEYRIVHQHASSLSYIMPLKIAKKNGVPIRIIHAHSTKEGGSFFHKYLHLLNAKNIDKIATHYYACSDFAADWFYNKKILNKLNFKIIKNGIKSADFSFNPVIREELRKKLNINEKFVIGHVGRFSSVKNHKFLVEIFKSIHNVDSSSLLILVGEGETKDEIQDMVNDLGLSNSVIFTGLQNNIAKWLQVMDVFVFPSIYEGLPVSLIEAQASGLQCIVSDTITKQVNITERIRYLDLSEPQKWIEAILERDQKYRRQDSAKMIKDSGYDIEQVTQYLYNIYTEKESSDEY